MPNIENLRKNTPTSGFARPKTLDREQLEYTFQSTLTYLTIALAVFGTLAAVTYTMTKQLRKD